MRKKRVTSLFISIMLVLSVFTGCGAETKKEISNTESNIAEGYQWKVEKDGKELYLIGTAHPINGKYDYFSDRIKEIMEKTDTLSVEVNETEEEQMLEMLKLFYLDGRTIENDLTKEEVKKLKDLCEEMDINYEEIKIGKATIINQLISEIVTVKAGLEMATFDDMLIKKYEEDGKKVEEIESVAFQMELMEKISGIKELKEILKEYKKGDFEKLIEGDIEYVQDLMEAYKNGDEEVMNEAIELQKEDAETYKAICVDRNIEMVKKIEGYMKTDKKYAVAVGALHFFGEDGIVDLLKNKGYSVSKVE